MNKTLIPLSAVSQLSKTDIAYATDDPALKQFYDLEPELSNFSHAISERSQTHTNRGALVSVLREQYHLLPEESLVNEHIEALLQADTFTVATAHQPSLLLGPLYFVYKAISTINLATAVRQATGKCIVPVFVLGSEDHDLDELNHIHLFNKKILWSPGMEGSVGEMPASTLQHVLNELRPILGETENAHALWEKIERSYTHSATFADATQALLHAFFGRFGLVVLNMNHPILKSEFIPIMWDDLSQQTGHRLVSETIERLTALGFKAQATPREINLFYMQPGRRERIVHENGNYKVLHTDLIFSPEAIKTELNLHPERFSPNVVLRPLFQELILPNLAYVGGGGELAYWLERRSLFEHYGLPYPILIRRNSLLWFDKDAIKRSLKFGFASANFFEDTESLVRAFIESQVDAGVNLKKEVADLQRVYDHLVQKAQAIDPTLEKAVRADEAKFVGHFQQWESRLMRAEKQKHEISLNQLRGLKDKLFPRGSLQERTDNFIPYYLKYGDHFFDILMASLNPLEKGFVVLEDTE